jgi:hypothetical protein
MVLMLVLLVIIHLKYIGAIVDRIYRFCFSLFFLKLAKAFPDAFLIDVDTWIGVEWRVLQQTNKRRLQMKQNYSASGEYTVGPGRAFKEFLTTIFFDFIFAIIVVEEYGIFVLNYNNLFVVLFRLLPVQPEKIKFKFEEVLVVS